MALFGSGAKQQDPYALLRQGDAAGAVRLLRKRLRKAPDDDRARNLLGDALVAAGDPQQALAEYHLVAEDLSRRGFTAKALAIWKKMARLAPEDAALLQRIAGPDSAPRPGVTPAAGAELPETPLFPDFRSEELAEVARRFQHRSVQDGEVLTREGDRDDSIFVVAEGAVEVSVRDRDGSDLPLGTLEPGAFFGEVAALTGRPRTATIRARGPGEVLELSRTDLEDVVSRHPRVREVLREFVEQRAESTVEAMVTARRGGPR